MPRCQIFCGIPTPMKSITSAGKRKHLKDAAYSMLVIRSLGFNQIRVRNQLKTEHYLSWHDTMAVFVAKPSVTTALSEEGDRRETEEIPIG